MDPKEIKELQDKLNEKLDVVGGEIKTLVEGQREEIKKNFDTTEELRTELKTLGETQAEIKGQMIELERLKQSGSENEKDMAFGFKHFGEFISLAIKNKKGNPMDDRFKAVNDYEAELYGEVCTEKGFLMPPAFKRNAGCAVDPRELKELSAGIGAEGGFFIQPQFGPMAQMFQTQPGIFRPRATVIPAGSPSPDAPITLPALDQSGSKGVHAGVTVSWINEGDTKDETDFDVRQIKLEPQEVAGYITVTDKLLRNAPAMGVLAQNLLRRAIVSSEDQAFYSGSGAGQPLGLEGHTSVILQTRNAVNQINYVDIVNMYSQIVFGGSYIWMASQTCLPELMTMADGGGHLVWMPNQQAIGNIPGTLVGIPVVMNNRSAVLGTQGDIMLVDLSYYYIKDGSGVFVASSEHVQFTSNKTLIKAFWNVDGQPAITSALQDENGETISPFVELDNVITS